MGCCSCLFKSIFTLLMILLNLPLLLIAIAFIVFGALGAWSFTTLVDMVGLLNNQPEVQNIVLQFLNSIDQYVFGISIAIFVVGIVIFAISFVGFFGACCNNVCLMGTYAALVGIVAIGAIATAIIFLVDSSIILGPLEQAAIDTMVNFNDPDNPALAGNISAIDVMAAGWTLAFREMPCCGVVNYTDFQRSGAWNRIYSYPNGVPAVYAQVPVMCCKKKERETKVAAGNIPYWIPGAINSVDTTCLSAPNNDNAYLEIGCLTYMATSPVAIWVMFGLSVGLLILFIMAVLLVGCYKKKRRSRDNSFEMH